MISSVTGSAVLYTGLRVATFAASVHLTNLVIFILAKPKVVTSSCCCRFSALLLTASAAFCLGLSSKIIFAGAVVALVAAIVIPQPLSRNEVLYLLPRLADGVVAKPFDGQLKVDGSQVQWSRDGNWCALEEDYQEPLYALFASQQYFLWSVRG